MHTRTLLSRTTGINRIAPLALLLAAAAIMPGCRGGGNSSGGGNVLRYALQNAPTSLDPAKVEDGDTIDMLQQVFEGLVMWNESNAIVPNLAEKWDVSNGGKTYTFHLKDGVKFHNGRKLVAEDVRYSITRALLPETQSPTCKTYLNDIVGAMDVVNGKTKEVAGIKVVDERTVQITLDAPRAYFLGKLTYPTGFVVCKEAIEKSNGRVDETSLVGTGPFKLTFYQSGASVKLAANKDYHGTKPILDGIERPIRLDSFTRQAAYESGGVEITDVQRSDVARIQKDAVLSKELHQLKRANIYYLAMNQLAFPVFKDKRVRQAFAHAINKDELINIALKGTATRANGILPPGVPGHDPAYEGLPYDPKKAQELLAAAGYAGGKNFPHLTITYRQGYQHLADGVQSIRNDLKQNLGIEVDTKVLDWTQFLSERNKGTMPCYHLRWAADYLDPQDFLSVMLRTGAQENTIGYSNPQFDALCDKADVEMDAQKRMDLYRQAQKIAVEDAPWVCIYYLPDIELQKPYVKGIRDSLMGHLPHVTTSVAR